VSVRLPEEAPSFGPVVGRVAEVVDLSDGRVVATLPTGSSNSWSGVSANGDLVVIFEWDDELNICDTASWEPMTSFVPGANRGIAISPDGSKLLTAQADGYVRIWDTHAAMNSFEFRWPELPTATGSTRPISSSVPPPAS